MSLSTPRSARPGTGSCHRVATGGSLALLAVGLGARIAPLLSGGERVFDQFPSEDAYLMLTIARNLAAGLGVTTSAGTIETNGIQPLATLLWSVAFWVSGGDRWLGVAIVQALEVVLSSGVALAIFRLARRLRRERPGGDTADAVPLLAAAVWYASPLLIRHSMNCQETSLYTLGVLLAVGHALDLESSPSLRRAGVLGAGLGVVFWMRNDGALLAAAIGLAHLVRAPSAAFRDRLLACTGMATAALAVAAPWLLYNLVGFGSIVPVSGRAESLAARTADHLPLLVTTLAKHMLVLFEITLQTARRPEVAAVGSLVVIVGGALYARAIARATGEMRHAGIVVALYAALLVVFYGAFFGAPFFLTRFLFPLSPFFAIGLVAGAWNGLRRAPPPVVGGVLAAVLAWSAWSAYADYQHFPSHRHRAKVEWVREHVSPEQWVGAMQTGTLGFFHDRTLNLDGKVNPAALAAHLSGTVPAYIVASPVEWIVDWPRLVGRLLRHPVVARHFELVAAEESLAVARRRPLPVPRGADGG